MKKHFKYLAYVARHKMYVFVECVKRGHPWLGLIHDWSKLRWSEFQPYANHFYGPDAEAYSKREKDDEAFDQAWLYHQNRNRHHWQYWLSINRKKETTVTEMPIKYTEEMLADWIGAARAKGQGGTYTPVWYRRYCDSMILTDTTRDYIEHEIKDLEENEKRK